MPENVRVGHINFINCLPLSYAFQHNEDLKHLEITRAVPSLLNEKIMAGELDISPVSSIVYAQHADKLLLLPNLSISADGGLESILLVSKKPMDKLDGATIALTSKSATSHRLLKVILALGYKACPKYVVTSTLLNGGILNEVDAVLLIGDDALTAYHDRQDYFYYDVGQEWKQLTGMQMVYALWVVRKEFAKKSPEVTDKVATLLKAGFNQGLACLGQAAASLSSHVPFSKELLSHYIGLLNYDLTKKHQEALLYYYSQVHDLGLLAQVPKLEFIEERK